MFRKSQQIVKVKQCRICRNKNLRKVIGFDKVPLADAFVTKEQMKNEKLYPLQLVWCPRCYLLQQGYLVNPKVLFGDFKFLSGSVTGLQQHFEELAKTITEKYFRNHLEVNIGYSPLVVDIGGNDGSLLEKFKARDWRVVNVDPALPAWTLSREKDIPSYVGYFDSIAAKAIRSLHGKAQVVTATNCFAHIQDWHAFLQSLDILLDENGVFVFEVPYLLDMIRTNDYSTIYHEHTAFFSLSSLVKLFVQHEFVISDAERIPVHGGSIRVAIKRHGAQSDRVRSLLLEEMKMGVVDFETYKAFARRIKAEKRILLEAILELHERGSHICAYGASARGTMILHGIPAEAIEYVVDNTPSKIGLYTPETHIPIVSEEYFKQYPPDVCILLIWTWKDVFFNKESWFKKELLIPLPQVQIVNS